MSYCVNCGVELSAGTKKCCLCDTPVINPNEIKDTECSPAFPERIAIPQSSKNKYAAIIISILLLIPNVVCVITNFLFTPELLWSIYVVSSSAMFWFLFVFPFIMKRKLPYLIVAVDAIATAAYIFIFYYYNSPRTDNWFWTVALPIDIVVFVCIAILIAFFSKEHTKAVSAIALLTSVTVLCILFCMIINLHAYSVIATYITMIIGISSFILLIFFIAVEKNKKLYSWLSRKFFY
ncbi:MAG: hypothetical protein IKW03_04920 [Clostridia bacterium]|nr:hypothetical protein [Clostridia bacterium]